MDGARRISLTDTPSRLDLENELSSRELTDQAVILAAGRGNRLARTSPDPGSFSKPLLRVAGKTLIRRALEGCAEAGVRRAIVVTGYHAEQVAAEVAGCTVTDGISVYNDRWAEPNGLSVLAAREAVDGDFYLLMADHLFESSILADLGTIPDAGKIALAVDPRLKSVLDLPDATKVLRSGDTIVDIGKSIPNYDAVDCGLFHCTEALFAALDRARAKTPPSLTDGLLELPAGCLTAMEIGNRWWQDVDTAQMAAAATEKLRRRSWD